MNLLISLIEITGSLGLFLYGMKILSDGLQKSAGNKLKKFLELMTKNKVLAVLTGFLITVLIQSSSATTVMVVSFVNAGLMNLVSAIGVIMGANIGTTVTGWIVALLGFSADITVISLFAIAIALPLMFSKTIQRREIAEVFLGFGLLFLGLEFLQSSMPDISGHTAVLEFLANFEDGSVGSILLCVLIGTLLTTIVQSSSATMAITITMAYQGWIGVWTASALCLGQNIGTTITAYIASIGTSTNAKRAAMGHVLFNVVGSFIAIIFFRPLMRMVNYLTPGDIFTMSGLALRETLPAFLAAFHTIFNLLNTLVFFPFINQFASFIERIVPEKAKYDDETYHFRYISSTKMDTPELYLIALKEEIGKMGELTVGMFKDYVSVFNKKEDERIEDEINSLKKKEEYADQMQEQLIDFSVKLQQDSIASADAQTLNSLIRSIDELESITDSIYNLSKIREDRAKRGIIFSTEDKEDVTSYQNLTLEFLNFVLDNFASKDPKVLTTAQNYEERMNIEHNRLADIVMQKLQNSSSDVKTELMLLEIERNLEHIGDYLINIIQAFLDDNKHTPSLKKL